eukprot:TRINITY_DN2258_c0_g1_i5.p1 TRINITY_DN2258_c0_g1~~TRINITY_DN2258_c0_g1_i5.p1  ORF type:complete len:562 (-),score=80.12 TRINITY_DN2258_c0_g1_i5:151-1836(-)
MPAHNAPLGLAFYHGAGRYAFPEKMVGSAIVALHGSWNRVIPRGYRVVAIPMTVEGQVGGVHSALLAWNGSNSGGDKGTGWSHRPVDVAVGINGEVLVTSDASNLIISVRYIQPETASKSQSKTRTFTASPTTAPTPVHTPSQSAVHTSTQSAIDCAVKGLFLALDGFSCVSACPDGQWANASSICSLCDSACDTCAGSASACTSSCRIISTTVQTCENVVEGAKMAVFWTNTSFTGQAGAPAISISGSSSSSAPFSTLSSFYKILVPFDLTIIGTAFFNETVRIQIEISNFTTAANYDLLVFVGGVWLRAVDSCASQHICTTGIVALASGSRALFADVDHFTPFALVVAQPTETHTRVFGDPHFVGLRGQRFLLEAPPGKVYNLISTHNVQVNALFVTGDGPRRLTVIGEVGILAFGDTVHATADALLQVNGVRAEMLTLLGERDGWLLRDTFRNHSGQVIEAGSFRIKLMPRGYELDLAEVTVIGGGDSHDLATAHGLLGQTWRLAGCWPPWAWEREVDEQRLVWDCLEGQLADYVVHDGLFGRDFAFNRYSYLPREEL